MALYAAAAVADALLGAFVPEALLSWPVGAGFLLIWVWLVPALVRRVR